MSEDDHPVVGVSYFEAMAYAAWAGKQLPTEEQWEKAARGDNGLVYPWGDEFDAGKCNTNESGIKGTTPVYKYPHGQSPYGCYDMAGNVWEWTVGKVLRGGSWDFDRDFARCTFRSGIFAPISRVIAGFRCVRAVK